ncbi:MAG TPA: hypothetical protein P5230_01610 [Candidatus Magasanikbacteria bacterium]|nr:hypothetical protein [Candidatus Magasanikbacteria bacterium]
MDFYTQKNNLTQRKTGTIASSLPTAKKVVKNGLSKYEDPTGTMTAGQFKFAAWYVNNRILLYRLLVGFLILFSAYTVIYTVIKAAWILIVEVPRDEKLFVQMTEVDDYERINRALSPQNLAVDETVVIPAGVDKYDAFTKVTNPNQKHIAYFDYYFDQGGLKTEKRSGFILPQETKPVVEFGLKDGIGGVLVLENIVYKRINAHLYADPISYMAERNMFEVENFEYKSVLHPEGANANIIKFDLKNGSPFHFYEPHFIVEFRNGGIEVGMAEIKIEKFESLQTKNVDLRSFADNLFVDEVVVYPSINYFERGEYFEPVR